MDITEKKKLSETDICDLWMDELVKVHLKPPSPQPSPGGRGS